MKINRIYHRSPMQTENFQSERKRIMPETRFILFPTLSVYSMAGISRAASETDNLLVFLHITRNYVIFLTFFVYHNLYCFYNQRSMTANSLRNSKVFVTAYK